MVDFQGIGQMAAKRWVGGSSLWWGFTCGSRAPGWHRSFEVEKGVICGVDGREWRIMERQCWVLV